MFALYHLRTALAMTVNELHVFLSSQLKQERERKIERLGKRQALYTHLYFPRGFRSRKWPSCGVRDTAYFRRCASSSLGLFFTGLHCMWRRGLPLSERCTHYNANAGGVQRSALAMKTTLTSHWRISPYMYKGSVATVQIQMPFHAVGRSFRPLGGS